jgi:hypothetical protein
MVVQQREFEAHSTVLKREFEEELTALKAKMAAQQKANDQVIVG